MNDCTICGKEVFNVRLGRLKKYCDECRVKVTKEQCREGSKRYLNSLKGRKFYKNLREESIKKQKEEVISVFGEIPRPTMINKNITSDGCSYLNSKVVAKYRRYSGAGWSRLYYLYEQNLNGERNYKIQVIISRFEEEVWFFLNKVTWGEANKFFGNIKKPYVLDRVLRLEKANEGIK